MQLFFLIALLASAILQAPAAVLANTYSVTNANSSGAGSLSWAVAQANANAGFDTIEFRLSQSDSKTLVQSGLILSDAVLIDGYSQSGAVENTNGENQPWNGVVPIVIEGDGASQPLFTVTAANVELRGLRLVNSDVSSATLVLGTASTDQRVTGCILGYTESGGAESSTIAIDFSGDANLVGGTNPSQRNVVLGKVRLEGDGNLVRGNLLGLIPEGDVPYSGFPGDVAVEVIGDDNIIGGAVVGARNVCTGEIILDGDRNRVRRNYLGLDVTGAVDLADGSNGVNIKSGNANVVGGRANGGDNYIVGFSRGVRVGSTATNSIIRRNKIGVGVGGVALGNGLAGIGIDVVGNGTQIGGPQLNDGNVIAHGQVGVVVSDVAQGVTIRRNSIFDHDATSGRGLGIDLGPGGPTVNDVGDVDVGANDLLNYPVLEDLDVVGDNVQVVLAYEGMVGETYVLEVFANSGPDDTGFGEGENLIRTETAVIPAGGWFQVSFSLPLSEFPVGAALSATATDAMGSTSEFSPSYEVVTTRVLSLADAGPMTLRNALEYANGTPGPDSVVIEIEGVIALESPLPAITDPVSVVSNTLVRPIVDGGALPNGSNGLVIQVANCLFERVTLDSFVGGAGFYVESQGSTTIRDCRVSRCDIGVDQREGTVVLEDSSFHENSVGFWLRGNGGVLDDLSLANGTTGGIIEADSVQVSDARFDSNSATGLWARPGADHMVVTDSRFFQNGFIGVLLQASNCVLGDPQSTIPFGRPSSLANAFTNNGQDGVVVEGTNNLIRPMVAASNGGLAVDLNKDGVTLNDPLDADSGPNGLLNYPVLTLLEDFGPGCDVRVTGEYHGSPDTEVTIDVYEVLTPCDPSGHGEAGDLETTVMVTTDGNGDASFVACVPSNASPGEVFSAQASTATSSSEMGPCLGVVVTGVPDSRVRPVATRLYGIQPNPVGASSVVQFALADPGFVEVSIFDVRGRRVRTLYDGHLEASEHVMAWDRNDDLGRRAAAGVYFVTLRSGPQFQSQKVLLLD